MAGRIRSIKPEILEDDRTASLTDLEWRVFVSAIVLADDFGNFRAHPQFVHGQIFWAHTGNEASDRTAAALETLEDVGLIIRYTVRGQTYAYIRNWGKHQRVDNAGKPRVPKMDDPEACVTSEIFVYFIQQQDDGPIKIGRASNVSRRLSQLQAANPLRLHLRGFVRGDREQELHQRFKKFRLSGEWFSPDESILSFLRELAANSPNSQEQSAEVSPLARARAQSGGETTDLRSPIPIPITEREPEPVATASLTDSVESASASVRSVFEYWVAKQSKLTGAKPDKLKLTTQRRSRIAARLADKYTVDDLKRAVDGVFANDFNTNGKYTDIELICRDAPHVDRYMNLAPRTAGYPIPAPSVLPPLDQVVSPTPEQRAILFTRPKGPGALFADDEPPKAKGGA